MKLKAQNIPVTTGKIICFLHSEEAEELQVKHSDRLTLKRGTKSIDAVVDISNTHHFIKKGTIGLSEETTIALGVKNKDVLQVLPADKPFSLEYLKKKIDNTPLNDSEMYALIVDLVAGKLSESEIAMFISSCYMRGMNSNEIISLIAAFLHTGQNIKFDQYPVVDVRTIGSPELQFIVTPILTAAGVFVPAMVTENDDPSNGTSLLKIFMPKMSDGLDITSSTFLAEDMLNIVPAASLLRRIELPVNIQPAGHVVAELIAKTRAIGSSHLVVLIQGSERLQQIRKEFERICKKANIRAMMTFSESPFIGRSMGSLLSVKEILQVLELHPEAPSDLKERALLFSGSIFEMLGRKKGFIMAKEILESGHAYDVFSTIIGKRMKSDEIEIQGYKADVRAKSAGVIVSLPYNGLRQVAKVCGAPYDIHAGIWFHKTIHDRVNEGEKILTLYASNKDRLEKAKELQRTIDDILLA